MIWWMSKILRQGLRRFLELQTNKYQTFYDILHSVWYLHKYAINSFWSWYSISFFSFYSLCRAYRLLLWMFVLISFMLMTQNCRTHMHITCVLSLDKTQHCTYLLEGLYLFGSALKPGAACSQNSLDYSVNKRFGTLFTRIRHSESSRNALINFVCRFLWSNM